MIRRLARDRRGATIVEFAIIAPTMMVLLMGLCDVMYQAYAQAILNGAIQKAGRDSALQGGAQQTNVIDGKVISMVGQIMQDPVKDCSTNPVAPSWCAVRRSYGSFSAMKPEPFTDSNGNGKRDPKECFSDVNGNGSWDADPGQGGQGGADDVTQYTMSVTYPRLFPVAGLMGLPNTQTVTASTLLKNQPYASQSIATTTTVCT